MSNGLKFYYQLMRIIEMFQLMGIVGVFQLMGIVGVFHFMGIAGVFQLMGIIGVFQFMGIVGVFHLMGIVGVFQFIGIAGVFIPIDGKCRRLKSINAYAFIFCLRNLHFRRNAGATATPDASTASPYDLSLYIYNV